MNAHRRRDREDRRILPLFRRFRLELSVLLALQLLVGLTLGLAYVPLDSGNAPYALLIAVLQLALVAVFFMHLRHAGPLVWLTAVIGFLFMAVMVVLTYADTVWRFG